MVRQMDLRRLVKAIRHRWNGDGRPPLPPDRVWVQLPVTLVDTVFGLRASAAAGGIGAPVRHYAQWVSGELWNMPPSTVLARIGEADLVEAIHTLPQMIMLLDPLSTADRVEVFGNRRPAFPHPDAPRRADTVVQAAHMLVARGIDTRADFERQACDPDGATTLRSAWTSLPGFGPRSWEHMLRACGVPPTGPDPQVTRAVREITGREELSSDQARELVVEATFELQFCDVLDCWTVAGVEECMRRLAAGGASPAAGSRLAAAGRGATRGRPGEARSGAQSP